MTQYLLDGFKGFQILTVLFFLPLLNLSRGSTAKRRSDALLLGVVAIGIFYPNTLSWFSIFLLSSVFVHLSVKSKNDLTFPLLHLLAGVIYCFVCTRLSLEFLELHGHYSMTHSDISTVTISRKSSLITAVSVVMLIGVLIVSAFYRHSYEKTEFYCASVLIDALAFINLFSLGFWYLMRWQADSLSQLAVGAEFSSPVLVLIVVLFISQVFFAHFDVGSVVSKKLKFISLVAFAVLGYILTRASAVAVSDRLAEFMGGAK